MGYDMYLGTTTDRFQLYDILKLYNLNMIFMMNTDKIGVQSGIFFNLILRKFLLYLCDSFVGRLYQIIDLNGFEYIITHP